MKEHLRLTIEELSCRMMRLEIEMHDLGETIDLLRHLDDPTEEIMLPATVSSQEAQAFSDKMCKHMSLPPEGSGAVSTPAGQTVPPSPPAASTSRARPGPKPMRIGKRFKGVVRHARKRGTVYEAMYWDPKEKRSRHGGLFDNELDAAMAVAKAIGDKDEIQRLASLIEQQENNPDRPAPKHRKRKAEGRRQLVARAKPKTEDRGQKTEDGEQQESELASMGGLPPAGRVAVAWQCRGCGHNHLQAERPKVCENCFVNHGFSEIK